MFSNKLITSILFLCQWAPPIVVFYIIATQQVGGVNANNVAGGIMMFVLMLLANAIQYNIIFKIIEVSRCPQCHSLGVKTLSKEIREHIKTTDRVYKYESKNGLFRKRLQKIFKYTTYDLYCPKCSHVYSYTATSTDTLRSGEQRIR